jgi:hypothetical protein
MKDRKWDRDVAELLADAFEQTVFRNDPSENALRHHLFDIYLDELYYHAPDVSIRDKEKPSIDIVFYFLNSYKLLAYF